MEVAADPASLPPVPPGAVPWAVAGLVLLWLALRVRLAQSLLARVPDAPRPGRWLRVLAGRRWVLPVLLGGILLCLVAVVQACR